MVDPELMCDTHLRGEHYEIHMLIGCLKRNRGIDGYIKNNCLQPNCIIERHDAVVKELNKRGFNHKSPVKESDINYDAIKAEYMLFEVNVEASKKDLFCRCGACKYRRDKGGDKWR
jgi:hypothetical protein